MRSATLAVLFLAAVADAETFKLDSKKSELIVKTWKDGVASGLAHNHVIRASDASGEITWDAANAEATKISVSLNVAALVVDRQDMRKKYGEDSETSARDKNTVTDHMLGEGQLDVAKFPTIRFVSTTFVKDAKGFTVTGKLTIHGVTREVKLPVKVEEKGGEVTGDGALKIKTSDFGFQPYSGLLGAVRNKDEVDLFLHLVGVKK